ncbi:SSU ribosomal protein S20P [Balneicella halophila]|uniref:Small ribosomal subunit protein bS20 n=1 Tax=Balneicella halophila TaxID=1537566 RepID=A0A7L4UNP4_BALHA|nr:30S ribosomal protein S20 [Balneicella halophila]PVX50735.1 SSU ribosomal protein S20P [Balneicella halophila]
MANHLSSKKRIRQSEKRRVHNRYYSRTTRNAVKALRELSDKKEAETMLPTVAAMLDKLAKKNIIHKSKAANLKSKLAKHVNHLEA